MAHEERQRPDPDALLAEIESEERQAKRGKLRLYFGASAGVGKTYAMLAAARKLVAEGQQVLIGVVETHGRSETAALLDGLDRLPLRVVDHRGQSIGEFDIDAALARRPNLVLVDELAHSNAPGSRHPKRWQDVDELLNAGIGVFTTLNVQHLESLNDIVGGITGVRVTETLPDTVFDRADEVVLVDLPADELLARLKAGKVYEAKQAEHAARHFFRKGNLIALRELALRRTADRIENDAVAYRVEQSINVVWKTGANLVACIGERPAGESIVRGAARLASQLSTDWHAIYVETPRLQRLPASARERILKTLKLAEDLGATTAVLSGHEVAVAVVDYARSHHCAKIVMGRPGRRRPWRPSHLAKIAETAPEIDLIELGEVRSTPIVDSDRVVPLLGAERAWQAIETENLGQPQAVAVKRYGLALAAVLLTASLAIPLLPYLDLANIVMLFLLAVVLVAVSLGRGPAVVATFAGVAAFDFFFVTPRFSFAVADIQYLVTFAVMLLVGLITAHLTASLRYQAHIAATRETRTRGLYEFSRELSGLLQSDQIVATTEAFVAKFFHAKANLLLPDASGRLVTPQYDLIDSSIAQWAYDRASEAGAGTDTLPASPWYYLPLVAPMRTRGVLAMAPRNRNLLLIPEQKQWLSTFAALAAIALERVHYIDVAQNALVRMESERLRNSLLTALSHDLRTPLTSLVGLSESLTTTDPPLSAQQQSLAQALVEESLRMNQLVTNLLDMARLRSGNLIVNRDWQSFEETVGSSLRASRLFLRQHRLQTELAANLPLLCYDAILIERVLVNLLENACKYTPPGSLIVISARVEKTWLSVTVADNGPGLPAGKEEVIFDAFTRGDHETTAAGVGLGLAICRAIVEAHGGTIHARPSPHGACIALTLPIEEAPPLPALDEVEV